MTVYERIAQAMEVIAAFDFDKSGQVTGGQSYKFIPIGQILRAVRQAHAKAGLFLTIGQLEYDDEHREGIVDVTINGKPYKHARGHCQAFINGADGDCVSLTVPFNVLDNSDKMDNKIVTNIERQVYRIIYAIDEGDATDTPPGEDPESIFIEDTGPAPIQPKQKAPPVNPKVLEKEAKDKASKNKVIEDIRWKCCMDTDKAEYVRFYLQHEHGYTGDADPDKLKKAMSTMMNLEQLKKLSEDMEVVE